MLKVIVIDRCENCDGEAYFFAAWAKYPAELCLQLPGQPVVCCPCKLLHRVIPPKKTHFRQNLNVEFSPSHSRKYPPKIDKIDIPCHPEFSCPKRHFDLPDDHQKLRNLPLTNAEWALSPFC